VLAVKPDTGKMAWYFQETPGDTWDFTSTQPIILADLKIDGKPRKVLLHAPKNGFFYVLDRITGEFISGEKYAKRVTWATGLDKKGRPIETNGARFTTEPVLLYPGAGGAHNWQPMSFNPMTGLVYIPGQAAGLTYAPDPNFTYTPGYWNTGVTMGRRPPGPDGKTPPAFPAASGPAREPEGAEDQPKASGRFLLAWAPVAQKERWRITNVGFAGGGTLATAGNLVFHGAVAYNAETGEKLWEADLGGASVSPVSYMLDGKQYISLLARSYPGNRLFTFVLDGKEPIPPAPPSPGRGGRGAGRGAQPIPQP
jgi:quinohemoprotein ethanol dehydrogenase